VKKLSIVFHLAFSRFDVTYMYIYQKR
jgi:hypothetical protein